MLVATHQWGGCKEEQGLFEWEGGSADVTLKWGLGWDLPADGLGHLVMDKFPASMDNIYDMITHSGKDISLETVIDHLRPMQIIKILEPAEEIELIQSLYSQTAPRNASKGLTIPLLRAPNLIAGCFTQNSNLLTKTRLLNRRPLLVASMPHYPDLLTSLSSIWDLGQQDSLKIKGIGSVRLSNEHGEFFLNYVLFIPDLVVNLISVIRNNKIKMSGNYIENLPTLEFENCKFSSLLLSAEFIHKSLGHIIKDCKSCAVAKVTRASYKSENAASLKPFEEIHFDLIGPIWPPSAAKSNVSECPPFLINIAARRFGYHPTTLHSDRGSEFIKSALKKILQRSLYKAANLRCVL
ncbi:hypothetical protein VP01_4165g1 [Puccinia sorghi]|uniref:Retrovirus-related Pol polyprotein from transposon TNT 1-94-like beta-barrel domain-containing protein n=1 Tax=Puccinia sorghi TaxID=27349 RepID=A0A0L6UQY5_9BASI|nr:hypothetical protein VP01_4165g1 [Puccinia sorghi]